MHDLRWLALVDETDERMEKLVTGVQTGGIRARTGFMLGI
jgi:hypothetical protein